MWSMDNWKYVERRDVADPKGRTWTVALMDVLGQEGDPDRPNDLVALEYSQGRYFTLIYSATGAMQWERGSHRCRRPRPHTSGSWLRSAMDGSIRRSLFIVKIWRIDDGKASVVLAAAVAGALDAERAPELVDAVSPAIGDTGRPFLETVADLAAAIPRGRVGRRQQQHRRGRAQRVQQIPHRFSHCPAPFFRGDQTPHPGVPHLQSLEHVD